MRRRHVFTPILIAALLVSAPVADAAGSRLSRERSNDAPARFMVPRLDGTPVMVENTFTGQAWSAWAYRSAGEYDIAISHRDESGVWNPPVFLGEYNQFSEVAPALAIDGSGTVYLAYEVRELGRIFLSVLVPGATSWSPPIPATASDERAMAPSLMVLGDYLVLGYRAGGKVVMVPFPIIVTGTKGVQDGPDILPPPGASGPRDAPPVAVPPRRN